MTAVTATLDALRTLLALACVFLMWLSPVPAVAALANLFCRRLRPRDPAYLRVRATILVGVLGAVSLSVMLPDGWPWSAFPLLGMDDTEWAPNYSAADFRHVEIGESQEAVLASVGEPLVRYPNERNRSQETWCWTRSPGSSHYRIRCVEFAHGKVVGKQSEYWVD